MTAQQTHRLWARFQYEHGTASDFVYWVQFQVPCSTGDCEFTVSEPDSLLWAKVPVVNTITRKFFRKGNTQVWSMSVTTARAVWEMMTQKGWHTTPTGAKTGKPLCLLTTTQLQEILKNETAGFC
jgi:hypothetical protein